jgi:mono/diheme cytochrome c family protein
MNVADWSRIPLSLLGGVLTLLTCMVARAQLLNTTVVPPGDSEFARHCASCHGAVLEGGQHAPPLAGKVFLSHWNDKPARSLYSRIISTMPQDNAGSLSAAQALSITLFVFSVNRVSLGDKPIASANDLNALSIMAPGAP